MFNVLRNNNLLQNNELRLISINNNFNNKLYLYILLSLYKNNLYNYNQNELNNLTQTYKTELNKYVKNKFNIKYLNLNSSKHLNILSDLLKINLKIYDRDFNTIKFENKNNYKKTLYFLLRNNDLYLVSNKINNNLSYKLKNNLFNKLYSVNPNKISNKKIIFEGGAPSNNIGLWDISKSTPTDSNWYSIEEVNKFLIDRCKNCLTNLDEARKSTTDICTATFSNIYREDIYRIIENINNKFQTYVNNEAVLQDIKLVIPGGDCFNHLLMNQSFRPISPDIDVKLVINSEHGNRLHDNFIFNYNEKEYDIFMFNIILLNVRNKLNEYLLEEVNDLNSKFRTKFQDFNSVTRNLYQYCIGLMNQNNIQLPISSKTNLPYIPYFESKSQKIIDKFQRRFNHMEAGYLDEELIKPFRINNILLYSIDCIYEGENETSYTGIPGILDIVISLPTHAGHMIVDESRQEYTSKIYNSINLTIMDKNYYIIKDNLKMVKYGLRTENKKILKDFSRLSLLLREDTALVLKLNKENVLSSMINMIKKLFSNSNYQLESDKNKLNEIKDFLECIIPKRERNVLSPENEQRNKKPLLGSGPNKCDIRNITKDDLSFDLDDSNQMYIDEDNIPEEDSFFKRLKKNLFGGSIDNIVVSYKLQKSLYFLVSDKFHKYSQLVSNNLKPPYSDKYLKHINNYNEQTNKLGPKIIKINYEKFTELTEGISANRKGKVESKFILTEAFNTSALYRFYNKGFNRWAPFKKDGSLLPNTSTIWKYYNIIINIVTSITSELNRNPNFIRQLYFFDINEDILTQFKEEYEDNPQMYDEYERELNTQVAKCLMHTFMYSFSPEYMEVDKIYLRFKGGYENLLTPIIDFYNKVKQISEGIYN